MRQRAKRTLNTPALAGSAEGLLATSDNGRQYRVIYRKLRLLLNRTKRLDPKKNPKTRESRSPYIIVILAKTIKKPKKA